MRERIASHDAIWLQDSTTNLMVINAVIITDRLDLATLRQAFQRRIFEGPEAVRFERLRCRITGKGLRRYWDKDPHFDLSNHIFTCKGRNLHKLEAIQAYVGCTASLQLDEDRPRWEIQVIEEFEEDATALLVRIHHSIGDGEALVSLMFTLMDGSWEEKQGMDRHAPAAPTDIPWLDRALRAVAIPLKASCPRSPCRRTC